MIAPIGALRHTSEGGTLGKNFANFVKILKSWKIFFSKIDKKCQISEKWPKLAEFLVSKI